MELDELMFWDKHPQLYPLYESLRTTLREKYPDMRIKVSKTQISFYNKHMFAMASPPSRRKKDWPKEFMMVSFGLLGREESAIVAVSVEAYPGRWTHHVIVEKREDLSEELFELLDKAYTFSNIK